MSTNQDKPTNPSTPQPEKNKSKGEPVKISFAEALKKNSGIELTPELHFAATKKE